MERFHLTLRRELLDTGEIYDTIDAAQGAVDDYVAHYNTERPHQALDMATPASRFRSRHDDGDGQDLIPLPLPATLELAPSVSTTATTTNTLAPIPADHKTPAGETVVNPVVWSGGPVTFERVVPASGNLFVAGKQFWLGPARAGLTVTFWADTDVIHLLAAGTRLKSLRSHLNTTDLAKLVARGAHPAGPAPLPAPDGSQAIEVDRCVNRAGIVSIGGHPILAAEILAGRQVSIRIEGATLTFFDPDTRTVLRTRPNPLTVNQLRRLKSTRPAGPPPRPAIEPVTVQRRVSATGVILVAGQKVALGRTHAGQEVTVHASDTTLTIEVDDDVRTIRRTTTKPVTHTKGHRPRKVPYVS